MIVGALRSLKANLIYVVLATLVVGLGVGQVIGPDAKSALQSAVLPVLFLMIYPMMINIDVRRIVSISDHLRVVLVSLLLNFGVAPLIAIGLSRLFFPSNPEFAIGLYFIALIPTSGMTAAWTGLAGGDLEGAVVAMAVNLLAAVVILPAYLSVLLEAGVGFDPGALYRQLATIVLVPMIAGDLTRRSLLRRYGPARFKAMKPAFGGVSSLGVVLIVFIAMAMRAEQILADPLDSALVVVPLVAFYVLILGIGSAVGRAVLDPDESVTIVYATSMRNLSIALAIVVAPGFPPTAAALPIALAYVFQPPLGALYMHYRRDVVDRDRTVRDALATLL